MQCPNCHEEVLLAEVCPYCGTNMPKDELTSENGQEETRGVFVGKLDEQPGRTERQAQAPYHDRSGKRPGFFSLIRYFFDSKVPSSRKLLIVGLVLYILSPIDLVSDFIPFLGWFDDLAVGTFLWSFISQELARYRNRT